MGFFSCAFVPSYMLVISSRSLIWNGQLTIRVQGPKIFLHSCNIIPTRPVKFCAWNAMEKFKGHLSKPGLFKHSANVEFFVEEYSIKLFFLNRIWQIFMTSYNEMTIFGNMETSYLRTIIPYFLEWSWTKDWHGGNILIWKEPEDLED